MVIQQNIAVKNILKKKLSGIDEDLIKPESTGEMQQSSIYDVEDEIEVIYDENQQEDLYEEEELQLPSVDKPAKTARLNAKQVKPFARTRNTSFVKSGAPHHLSRRHESKVDLARLKTVEVNINGKKENLK